jgi:hypothetical protein
MKSGKTTVAAISLLGVAVLLVGLFLAHGSESGELLKATPDRFDAGTVAEGKAVEVTASVQNVGSVPVEITNVRTS